MKILAISGSLRAASINSMCLRAVARLAPSGIEVTVFSGVGTLPLFNPDIESRPPAPVTVLHASVAAADALLIASPEYAHGVTGVIKNTLDWLVGFEPFACKPVAVLNTSPRAHHADTALREILKTMSAVVVETASISVPLLGANLTDDGLVSAPAIADAIRGSLVALSDATIKIQSRQDPDSAFFQTESKP